MSEARVCPMDGELCPDCDEFDAAVCRDISLNGIEIQIHDKHYLAKDGQVVPMKDEE